MVGLTEVECSGPSRFEIHGILLLLLFQVLGLGEDSTVCESFRVTYERVNNLVSISVLLFQFFNIFMLHPLRLVIIDHMSIVFTRSLSCRRRSHVCIIILATSTLIIFWRVHRLIEEEFVRDLTLWLFNFLENAVSTVNDTKDSLPRLSNHHAKIYRALVCILNLLMLRLDNTMVPRIVDHDEVVTLFNHITLSFLLKLIIIILIK